MRNTVDATQIPLSYVLSKGGLIDLVSCLPAFGAFQPWMSSLAFIRYISFLSIRIYEISISSPGKGFK